MQVKAGGGWVIGVGIFPPVAKLVAEVYHQVSAANYKVAVIVNAVKLYMLM